MKLGTKVKKETITNPFRPKTGINRRKKTICRITLDNFPKGHSHEYCIRIDADGEPQFLKELNSLIPAVEKYWDVDYEVFFTLEKYKVGVIDLARDYFSEVYYEDEKGKLYREQGKNP